MWTLWMSKPFLNGSFKKHWTSCINSKHSETQKDSKYSTSTDPSWRKLQMQTNDRDFGDIVISLRTDRRSHFMSIGHFNNLHEELKARARRPLFSILSISVISTLPKCSIISCISHVRILYTNFYIQNVDN